MRKHKICLSLLLMLAVILLCAEVVYAENNGPSAWSADYVNEAIRIGLVPEDMQNSWQQPITRLDFCRLISGLLPLKDGPVFSDCDSPEVSSCAAYGIVNGYTDGTFRPDNLITREEAAAILRRSGEAMGIDCKLPVSLDLWADMDKIAPWAAPSVQWVSQQGIMLGTGSAYFTPKANYTKEQSVVTIMRFGSPETTEVPPVRTLHSKNDTIEVFERTAGAVKQKVYDFSDGTRGVIGRTEKTDKKTVVYTGYIGNGAVVRASDGKNWTLDHLTAGKYSEPVIYIYNDKVSYMIYVPQQFRLRENASVEYLPGKDGWLEVTKVTDGYCLRLYSNAVAGGCVSDYMALSAPNQLFNWDIVGPASFMAAHTLHGDGRFCFDGYYYIVPDDAYIPWGKNIYYRCTACYFGSSMAQGVGYYRGCEVLSAMVYDTMALQQGEEGFIPQDNFSCWLNNEYKMGTGYYDTRFNSDLIEIWMMVYKRCGLKEITASLNKYFDFYLDHAQERHRETAGGGWFVDDYYNPSGGKRTHTSMNHQLAEAAVLYKAASILNRPELTELADKMILAIEDTASKWIKQNNDLYYSFKANGTYGGNDYPEITYNDLYNMQNLLVQMGRERSEKLQQLMDAKLIWMKANKVTTYLK